VKEAWLLIALCHVRFETEEGPQADIVPQVLIDLKGILWEALETGEPAELFRDDRTSFNLNSGACSVNSCA
jgi:hypothetical protein